MRLAAASTTSSREGPEADPYSIRSGDQAFRPQGRKAFFSIFLHHNPKCRLDSIEGQVDLKDLFLKEGRLRAPWKVLFSLLAYFLLSIVVQIIVISVYFAFIFLRSRYEGGIAVAPILPGSLPELPLSLLVVSSFASLGVAVIVIWVFVRFLDRRRLFDLGLRLEKSWVTQIAWGTILGVLLLGLVFAAEWLAGWLMPLGLAGGNYLPILGFFLFFVSVAINEELVFRGYTLQTLQQEWGTHGALLVSSLLFALFHGLNPNFSWRGFLGIFLAGILLGYAYLVARSLWLPIALHFAWNFAEGPIFSFAVSGLETPGIVVWQAVDPDPLWTGGSFGPEGGLLGLAAIFVGLGLLRLSRRWLQPVAEN